MERCIYTKEAQLYKEYDVVVAGGGPAGIGAAIGAAKNGVRVLVIEGNGCLGGDIDSWRTTILFGSDDRINSVC